MDFIPAILALLIRPLAAAVKTVLPECLAKHFEPDSNLGDYVGFGVLALIFAFLILVLRVYM